MGSKLSIVMIGATGAVGTQVVRTLVTLDEVERITLLGRRPLTGIDSVKIAQHVVDVLDASTYGRLVASHCVAICTLGVGQPSKVTQEEFMKLDRYAVQDFAEACKKAGISHFELLNSVGADETSSSFYLRTKGKLNAHLNGLNFNRLSLFQPSMILTPTNRYGWSQGLTLAVWPVLQKLFFGRLRKLRGVKVEQLGRAIVFNILTSGPKVEVLQWDDFTAINAKPHPAAHPTSPIPTGAVS